LSFQQQAAPSPVITADAPPPPTEDDLLEIKTLGYWESVWRTFKRDKVAIGGGVTIILLILVCFVGAPIFVKILHHGPNDQFSGTAVDVGGIPVGPWSHVSTAP
jgi:peptide/nickel transport system permease protein